MGGNVILLIFFVAPVITHHSSCVYLISSAHFVFVSRRTKKKERGTTNIILYEIRMIRFESIIQNRNDCSSPRNVHVPNGFNVHIQTHSPILEFKLITGDTLTSSSSLYLSRKNLKEDLTDS